MSGTLQDIDKLVPLLDMAYQVEQMKMAKVLARINDLQRQLDALERPAPPAPQTIDAVTLAGTQLLWETWAQNRKVVINQELALAFRDREAAKEGLIKALSKSEAAGRLRQTLYQDAKQTKDRRSNW